MGARQPSTRQPFVRLLLVLIILAFALRLPGPGSFPPGLYHDEAYYGLDAAGVLQGNLHVYFPANNGREPLFIYLVAPFIAILGRTPAALRLASCFVGTLGVAAAFALGRTLFNRRVGVLTAAFTAVTPWPVILSRTGFRAGTLPVVLSLAVAASVLAWREWPTSERDGQRGDRWILISAILTGLTAYTYTASRLVPLLAIGMVLWLVVARHWRPDRRRSLMWLAVAGIVVLPLAIQFARVPADLFGRAEQVSVFDSGINHGRLLETLWRNVQGVAGMLWVRGDFIPRHNIPNRPVFETLAGMLAAIGLAWLVVGALRRCTIPVLVLMWAVVMALPTLLAENAPHFLRAVGLVPVAMLLPALGTDAACGWWERLIESVRSKVFNSKGSSRNNIPFSSGSKSEWAGGYFLSPPSLSGAMVAVAVVAIVLELGSTLFVINLDGYLDAWADLHYQFETGAVELAKAINDDSGHSWSWGWTTRQNARSSSRSIWLDRRLRDGWASVPYLVPEAEDEAGAASGRFKLIDPYDPICFELPGVAFVQSDGLQLDEFWSKRAAGIRVETTRGADERGDLATEAHTLYWRIRCERQQTIAHELGTFANGLRLVTALTTMNEYGSNFSSVMLWEATRPITGEVTASWQILYRGGGLIAANDAPIGDKLFPTQLWRAGDQFQEVRSIEVPGVTYDARMNFDPQTEQMIVGIYVNPSAQRIPTLDAPGRPSADHLVLPPPR